MPAATEQRNKGAPSKGREGELDYKTNSRNRANKKVDVLIRC